MKITLDDYKKIVGQNNTILTETEKREQELTKSLKGLNSSSKEAKSIWDEITELENKHYYANKENVTLINEAINNDLFEMSVESMIKEIEEIYPFAKGKIKISYFSIDSELTGEVQDRIADMSFNKRMKIKDNVKFVYENSQNREIRLWFKYDGIPLCFLRAPYKLNSHFEDGKMFVDCLEKFTTTPDLSKNTIAVNFSLTNNADIKKLNLNFVPEEQFIMMNDISKDLGIELEGIQTAIFNCAERNATASASDTATAGTNKDVEIKK